MKKWILAGFMLLAFGLAYGFYDTELRHDLHYKMSLASPLPIVDLERIKKVHIINLSASNNMDWFDRKFLEEPHIYTSDDFYQRIMEHYHVIHDELVLNWKITDEQTLKSLYFMNVVSNMWGYGNKGTDTKTGCACTNEINEHAFPCETQFIENPEAYIYTKIGCCADSARVFKFLLTKAGIKNRYMQNPGHIFNDVWLGGHWQSLDATTNMWWRDSWENIQNAETHYHFSVSIFPMYGEVLNHPFYRPFIGVFRHYMLLEAVYKMAKDIKHPDVI
jgi:hypothetical protein